MDKRTIPFSELQEQVLEQLKNLKYMESTLTIYSRFYNRVHEFLKQQKTDIYTEELGNAFLATIHVSDSTLSAYKCAIRRLNDYIADKPYKCHHDNPSEEVTVVFADILKEYLTHCKDSGNMPATIAANKKACIAFLNFIDKSGCTDLSSLNPELLSKALLIFTNKDNYGRIRVFLNYLADKGITIVNFSGIVPRYKRQKPLPTTYTPEEIRKVENSVDISTDTGKRDIAIIRLATRMGLRSGDIARLKRSEIDFISGYISIIQEKTGQPLSLQMPQEVSEALSQHLANNKNILEDDFVFHSMSAPYGRITTSIIRHVVVNSFINAGVDTTGKKHGPHAFRSSLASSMVNDGGSYETVRSILGHSDPNVIKHYAKTDIEKLRLCSIDPPLPSGIFLDYLSGKKVINHV